MAEQEDRTEAPSARRLNEARESGNIPRSPDLTASLMLLVGILLMRMLGLKALAGMRTSMEVMLAPGSFGEAVNVDSAINELWYAGQMAVVIGAPLVTGVAVVALLANFGQVGFLFTTKPLEFSFARLNPLKGLNQILDSRARIRLLMAIVKTAIIATLAVSLVMQELPMIIALPRLAPVAALGAVADLVYRLAIKLLAVLIILALLDYAYQRWQHIRDLRMTKQEIKEEMRSMEGDPLIKQRRARVARQLVMQRLGMAVPKADVVVTNPTHFAIALKYDSKTMKAPRVVAKGADYLAMRIRQLATQSGVPMVERKELAQALYKTVEVGQEVPPQFYSAIAEVLAYVYRLAGKKTA